MIMMPQVMRMLIIITRNLFAISPPGDRGRRLPLHPALQSLRLPPLYHHCIEPGVISLNYFPPLFIYRDHWKEARSFNKFQSWLKQLPGVGLSWGLIGKLITPPLLEDQSWRIMERRRNYLVEYHERRRTYTWWLSPGPRQMQASPWRRFSSVSRRWRRPRGRDSMKRGWLRGGRGVGTIRCQNISLPWKRIQFRSGSPGKGAILIKENVLNSYNEVHKQILKF